MGVNLIYYTNDYRNLRERNEGCLVSVAWYIAIHFKFRFSNTTSVMLNHTDCLSLCFQPLEQKETVLFYFTKGPVVRFSVMHELL